MTTATKKRVGRASKFPRKNIAGSLDRDGRRVQVPFTPDEFAIVSAIADGEFESVAETVHDLAIAGLASRNGAPVPLTGFAAARAEEKSLKNQLLEFELAKKRRETLTVDQALQVVEKDYGSIRSRLLNIPQAMIGLSTDQSAELKRLIQDCMTDLSGGQKQTYVDIAEDK